jgi:NAD(P)H-hydrate epimerase
MRILAPEAVRRLDLRAISELGLPAALLMDTAGRAIADAIEQRVGPGHGRWAVVLAGAGNNGGDGWVVARVLAGRGWRVEVYFAGDPHKMTAETHLHFHAAQRCGGIDIHAVHHAPRGIELQHLRHSLQRAAAIVDALAGIGLQGELREPLLTLAAQLNGQPGGLTSGAIVVAADIPSGLCSTTGQVLGSAAVHCDLVVAMGALKPGLLLNQGPDLYRELLVADIGIPPAWLAAETPAGHLLDAAEARGWLPDRPDSGHKGSFGHLLAIAGSPGKVGAALLSAEAALRVGAGLLTLGTWASSRPQLEGRLADAMVETLHRQPGDTAAIDELLLRKTALLIGPGLGIGHGESELVRRLCALSRVAVLLDADALSALAAQPELAASAAGRLILTPHPGEMARLLNASVDAVEADRLGAARQAAARWNAIVVLKGHRSLIAAPDGRWALCNQPNAALARGGSGDVLAGTIGGLLAQGVAPFEAACLGVWLHSRAGALMRRDAGTRSGLASELASAIGSAVKELEEQPRHGRPGSP